MDAFDFTSYRYRIWIDDHRYLIILWDILFPTNRRLTAMFSMDLEFYWKLLQEEMVMQSHNSVRTSL